MTTQTEFTIVTETFNLAEGTELSSLKRSFDVANAIAGQVPGGLAEVLLADVDGRPEIDRILADYPRTRKVDCQGLGYDAAKNRAAHAARGEFVVFLDGDCVPEPGWIDALLEPLRAGRALASCGFTRYEGRFWGAIQTVLDFGFLLPLKARSIGCYPSNNWAVRRTEIVAQPIPENDVLRCSCYIHAQALIRRGTPIEFAPRAVTTHDLPSFWSERLRRGYDFVAACWVDPSLPEARHLRYGLFAAPRFYADNVALDWKRLRRSWRELGFTRGQRVLAFVLLPILRLVDVVGIVRALLESPERTAQSLAPTAPNT
jgi:glycosyltransferase involved in cell wall biosynthesis